MRCLFLLNLCFFIFYKWKLFLYSWLREYRKQWPQAMSHVNEDTTATVRHIPLTPSHTCANTHKHTLGPWHISSRNEVFHWESFFFFSGIFKVSAAQKNGARCQDGWGRGNHDWRGKHREGRYHNYTGHITLTGRDGTAQRRGAERESQRGRVRKQSSGRISMWWLCGCVSVLLPSNLWSICPGLFCIFVTMGCVNLRFALTSPVWCACITCSLCVNVCVCWWQGRPWLCVLWGLGASDDTFEEQRTLGSCRGQQLGLALRGQVLQVMSAPYWGG